MSVSPCMGCPRFLVALSLLLTCSLSLACSCKKETVEDVAHLEGFSFFADISTLKRDNSGSFVWVLINETASRVQSQRQMMHVSCVEKKFAIDEKIQFSQANARGSVLYVDSVKTHSTHEWSNLTILYSKLLVHTC